MTYGCRSTHGCAASWNNGNNVVGSKGVGLRMDVK